MQKVANFVDLLEERRKDCDISWVSRSIDILMPHNINPEIVFTYKETIEATLKNPKVASLFQELSLNKNIPESVLLKEAQEILREMASKSHLPTVRWLGLLITKVLKRILLSIHLNEYYLKNLKVQMRSSQVQYVYAPTHRSYLDFVLLSYILFSYNMALPNIASGMDFYKMKIIGELLRNTGAFYMRRTFATDPVYKEIFRAYVDTILCHSQRAIEFFIEGTRSRCQKSLTPKYGLLSTILEGLFRSNVCDINFVPICISYDKPLEELLFTYELLGVPKPPESTTGLFRSLSILSDPHSYGPVFIKFCEPISARKFMDMSIRKSSALSPNAKLPPQITKNIAYAIIETHKNNTILTSFNLISLLFNDRMFRNTSGFYSLDELIDDYKWIKNIIQKLFNATIDPTNFNEFSQNGPDDDGIRAKVLQALDTHKNLIQLDNQGNLRILCKSTNASQLNNVKGHLLDNNTLRVAVPIVNLMIYVNPTMAHLAKLAIAASCVNNNDDRKVIYEDYKILRCLLSAEFALVPNIPEFELQIEWSTLNEILNSFEQNSTFLKLLQNLMNPFITAAWTVCEFLNQRDSDIDLPINNLLRECQKRIEDSLYQTEVFIKHPYSLSLDIYLSVISSLSGQNIVNVHNSLITDINKETLLPIILKLERIQKQNILQHVNNLFLVQSSNFVNIPSKL